MVTCAHIHRTLQMKSAALFVFCLALVSATRAVDLKVDGFLDGANKHNIWGWTCQQHVSASLSVHVYLNGPSHRGQFFKAVKADRHSEAAVSRACKTNFNKYRYVIPLTAHDLRVHAGKKIYVHGIGVVNNINGLLHRSGLVRIPGPIPSPSPRPHPVSCRGGRFCVPL